MPGSWGPPRLHSSWALIWSSQSPQLAQVVGGVRFVVVIGLRPIAPPLTKPVPSRAICFFVAKVFLPGRAQPFARDFYLTASGPPTVSPFGFGTCRMSAKSLPLWHMT